MLRKYIVIAAASLLWGVAAHAEAKKGEPGYYAEHSTAFAEYLANCGPNYHVSGDAKLTDEAAHKIEQIKVLDKKNGTHQYELQVEACRATMPGPPRAVVKAAEPVQPKPVAEAEQKAPAPVERVALNRSEDAQLKRLLDRKAEQLLGARPRNSRGYIGDMRGHLALKPGCTERKVEDRAIKRVFVRVTCR